MADLVDTLLGEWADQRPELDCSSLGAVVRIQLLGKLLSDSTEAALAEFGLKLWEYDVLSALRRQGEPHELLASELARASMLTSGTVTTRVDGLEDRGLVERHPDPGDRRAIRVRLTPSGLATINKALSARMARASEQLRGLSVDERRALSALLRRVMLETLAEQEAA